MTNTEPAQQLCTWYTANSRQLPWRETCDPYRIWLSETMLQQTRVETVIPYYHGFLTQFPTLRALADASEDAVLKRWQGLGYYARVRNLHRAAKQVVADYDGVVPSDPAVFAKLPGVGPYTCGAVQSIAFDKPVPAVDGNVLRVLARFLGITDAIELPSVRRRISAHVSDWLQGTRPAVLTQALMELGAIVCTPRAPQCDACPLSAGCQARQEGRTDTLPVRQAKRPRRKVDVYALWLRDRGMVCIERRPSDGLLGAMWQLPSVEQPRTDHPPSTEEREQLLYDKLTLLCRGITPQPQPEGVRSFAKVATEKHVFTHIEWQVEVYRPVGDWWKLPPEVSADSARTVSMSALDDYAWPRVYEKLIAALTAGLIDA